MSWLQTKKLLAQIHSLYNFTKRNYFLGLSLTSCFKNQQAISQILGFNKIAHQKINNEKSHPTITVIYIVF